MPFFKADVNYFIKTTYESLPCNYGLLICDIDTIQSLQIAQIIGGKYDCWSINQDSSDENDTTETDYLPPFWQQAVGIGSILNVATEPGHVDLRRATARLISPKSRPGSVISN